jgi:tight adherence protein B
MTLIIALFLIFISLAALLLFALPRLRLTLANLQSRLLRDAEKKADDMFMPLEPRKLWVRSLVLGLTLALAIGLLMASPAIGLIAGALAFCLPAAYLSATERKRRQALDKALPSAIEKIAASLRAGAGLQTALESASTAAEGPFGQEMAHLLREVKIGVSLEDALARMAARVNAPDFTVFCTALTLALRTGGSLSDMLDTIAKTVRERRALDGKIKSLTSQGVMQGWIVGLMPLALLAGLTMVDPAMTAPLFNTGIGNALLITGAILEMLGMLMIRRIVKIAY